MSTDTDLLPDAEARQALRWTVHEARADSDADIMALFQQVFGHPITEASWKWKYAQAPLRGTLLRRQGEAAAFYGGMPRLVQGPQRLHAAVQNGDVMVKADERGVFTRRGAFFHVTHAFLQRYIGEGRLYEFGYGFPNQRAYAIGERLGLYVEGGRMQTVTWSPQAGTPSFWTVEEQLLPARLSGVDGLWKRMCASWHGLYMPVRDGARWHYRFAGHPSGQYRMLVVRRRLGGTALCALVLREHAGHLEWLDFCGPREAVPLAVAAARRLAAGCGDKPLTALVSDAIVSDMSIGCASCEPSGIVIPLRAPEPGWTFPYPWQGKLWLMGGDTDFL